MEDNRRVSSTVGPRSGSLSSHKGGSGRSGSRSSHSTDSGDDLLHLHPHPLPGTKGNSRTGIPDANAWLEAWREKFEQGTLTAAHFTEQWRIWVPKIYGPRLIAKRRHAAAESTEEAGLEWGGDKDEAQRMLFEPFERFICGGDPDEVLEKLKEKGSHQVCGRVFRLGEATYSCKDCGADSTCVLCFQCFKQSAHRHHKYKMGTSGGGGCCDCGDLEAWKSDPCCKDHAPPPSPPEGEGENSGQNETHAQSMDIGEDSQEGACGLLAPDIERRAKIAFTAALHYAFKLLTLEHAPGLPADMRQRECCQEADGRSSDGSEGSPENGEGGDIYCTVIYNDEFHTFEQVISTVSRVLKCTQREAIQYVTDIDIEGRAVLKCAKYKICSGERSEIERFTARHGGHPLKVLVMHAHAVAHQVFALRLLAKMRTLLSQSKVLRAVFSEVVHQGDSTELSILEGILRRNCFLWKSARLHWHYLFITGMLMEYPTKKLFAQVFTKNYGNVLKDFIRDDHDHSFSVACLAVQIYSVPSIAMYLIAYCDALYPLMNTFLSECALKCNREGKLEFERNVPNVNFKRAQYILYDLRYLLSSVPTTWTDALRKGFLQGYSLLLSLLTLLQGMDAATRQTGQHLEYEPEWESAFNLHLKLADVVALFIDWCATDRVVLIKAYRATLKKLQEAQIGGGSHTGDRENKGLVKSVEAVEVGEHSTSCIKYDVASQPVSVHLPLSRILAGLHLHLHKHGLSFDSPEFHPDRFVLHSKPTPVEIMEPILRCQVMIAQVNAGMWRRNGYALMNQLYFYHNVKCRTEMLDRDIVILQMAASLLEGNEFIIHLLNRFDLVAWANPEFEITSLLNPAEEKIHQTISLIEEMLGLLVTICGERWTVGVGEGVTKRSVVRREVVQHLFVRPMAHSELSKVLPLEDGGVPSSTTSTSCLDDVLAEVAVFKPASGSTPANCDAFHAGPQDRGVYHLKPELADEYDVFFYHYTREEMSKSEVAQRKRKKALGELECCPPPAPPPLSPPFAMLANLLQCDLMLDIMVTVLQRSADLRARSFSETQLHKTLHLIGYALHEEERSRKRAKEAEAKCAAMGGDAISEVGDAVAGFFCFTERAEKMGIPKLMENLVGSPRVEAHRDMLIWTIEKLKQVVALRFLKTPDGGESSSSSGKAERPESGREVVFKRRDEEDEASKEKERRTKMAAVKRAKIMEQMMAMQRSFLRENAQLFEATIPDSEKNSAEAEMEMADSEESSHVGEPVAFGPRQTPSIGFQKRYTCILCQEEEDVVRGNKRAIVLSAFVQRSTVLCSERERVPRTVAEQTAMQQKKDSAPANAASSSSVRFVKLKVSSDRSRGKEEKEGGKETRTSENPDQASGMNEEEEMEEEGDVGGLCLGWNLGPTPHTSTCGHVMHAHCWQLYYASVLTRENRRPYRFRQPTSFDVENKEFLCPLCECLSNTVLPLVPTQTRNQKSNSESTPSERSLPFGAWVRGLNYTLDQAGEGDDGWTREASSRPDVTAGTTPPARRNGSRIPVPSNSSLGSSPTQLDASGPAGAAIRRHRMSHSSGATSSSHQSSGTNMVDVHLCPLSKVIEELGPKYGPQYAKLFQHSADEDSECSEDISKEETPEASSRLSNTLSEMVLLFCQTTFEKGMDSEPELSDEMIPLLAWQSTAYTIHALEWLLRSSEGSYSTPRSLLGHLSSRQRDCLRGLVQLASSIETVWREPMIFACHAVRILNFLLPEEFSLEGSEVYRQQSLRSGVCLLDWDSFGLLVPLLMTMHGMYVDVDPDEPETVNGSSLRDLYALRLVLLSHITKIILTADFECLRETPMEVDGAGCIESQSGPVWREDESIYSGAEGFKELVIAVRESAGLDPTPIMDISPRALWKKVANDSVAFLRCSALLAHFLSGVSPSSALETPGGATFHALCDYLGLSPSNTTPASPASMGLDGSCEVSKELALGWSRHRRLRRLLQQNASKPLELRKGPAKVRQPIGVNQLVSLPEDYSELIDRVSLFHCPSSDGADSRNPTLCLVCGEILCSQNYCCQMLLKKMLVGACNFHAHHCGAGVGLFLRVRECEVLITSAPIKACLVLAPYLDRYGESDPGLKRGDPLRLSHERYARLHALWLSHALPEEVARSFDITSSPTAPNTPPTNHLFLTMQWQYL